MAWNSRGEWELEDTSTSARVAQITSRDSPLMRQAGGVGMMMANRRGLANSSIAARSAQDAIVSAATPIASQDSQQINALNAARMNNDHSFRTTAAGIAADERKTLAANIAQASDTYQRATAATLADYQIPEAARTSVLSSQRSVFTSQIASLERLFGVNLNWGTTPSAQPVATPPRTTAPTSGSFGLLGTNLSAFRQ